jgi:di/tricarboxylate transporter
MPSNKAFALFGNEAVFFILGVFILAASLMKSRLSTRLALVTLRRFGNTPHQLLVSIYLLNAFMSFFMSEHAVAAMNFPSHGVALTKSANASHRPTAGFGPQAIERRTLSLVTHESPERMSFQ